MTFTATIAADNLAEANENFEIAVDITPGAGYQCLASGTNYMAVLRPILANDPMTVTLAAATNACAEGSACTITINRSGGQGGFIVNVAYTPITATGGGTDYTEVTSVSFTTAQTTASLTPAIVDDALAEAAETFRVDISYGALDPGIGNNFLGAITQSTVTIASSDPMTLSLAAATNSCDENGPACDITPRRFQRQHRLCDYHGVSRGRGLLQRRCLAHLWPYPNNRHFHAHYHQRRAQRNRRDLHGHDIVRDTQRWYRQQHPLGSLRHNDHHPGERSAQHRLHVHDADYAGRRGQRPRRRLDCHALGWCGGFRQGKELVD
jgi:hypothetical protein